MTKVKLFGLFFASASVAAPALGANVTTCTVQSGYAVHIISFWDGKPAPGKSHTLGEIVDGDANTFACRDDHTYCTRRQGGDDFPHAIALELDYEAGTLTETVLPDDPNDVGWRDVWPMTCSTVDENVNEHRFDE